MSSESPKKIGQYELRKIIGRGGMATVWRAYQPNLDREVAIKLMAAQFSDDESFTKRFNQEARSIARLRHPNILSIYEYGQEDGQPFIVTELLEGGTLREYTRNRQLEPKEIVRILNQIADALDYAHANGMVHRDIKPSNILMGTQRVAGDRAVLGDFGIVKLMSGANLTQTGTGVGTPEYMSPEQASGESIDGRSDEYSLAIVLYELLTGVTPYKSDTPLAVMMGHVNRPLPDPRYFNPHLSDEVVAVLDKALAKFPGGRYDSVKDFAEAFQQATLGTGPAVSVPIAPVSKPTPAPASDRTSTQAGFVTVAQAYDYALLQEHQGNQQAAFETLTDIHRREPGYRDVATKLKGYQTQHFQYSGDHTLFRPLPTYSTEDATLALDIGPTKSPTITAGTYVPSDPTAIGAKIPNENVTPTQVSPVNIPATAVPTNQTAQPPAITKPGLSGKTIGIAIGTALLVGVVLIIVLLVTGGQKTPTPVAANPTVTVATAVTTIAATTAPTSQAATTSNVTTASPTTVPATAAPTELSDPLRDQVTPVVNAMYKPEGSLKDGVAKLKQLVQSNPNSWLAQRELGRVYYWYIRDQGGISYLKQATTLNPQDAVSWAYLAVEYADDFQDAEAQTAVRQALNLAPDSSTVRAASAITLIRGAPEQAKKEVEKALAVDPNGLLANYAAWSVYLTANDFSNATNYLDKVLQAYPNFAVLAYSRGYQLDRQNRPVDAATWYNKALQIDPDFPLAHTAIAQDARLSGKFDVAQQEYQKAISVYSNDVNAFIGLGYTLDSLKQLPQALEQFLKAITLDKDNAEAYNGLAGVYLEQAKAAKGTDTAASLIDMALTQANQAIALNPTYTDAFYHKGAAYFLKQDYPDAQAAFQQTVTLDNKNALYYYSLGATYYAQNDTASAKTNLQKALQVDPNFTPAQDLLKRLGGQ